MGKTYQSTPRQPNLTDWINLVSIFNEAQSQRLFLPEVLNNIDSEANSYAKWYQKGQEQKLDTYSLASYLDYKTYIHGDILTKVDIAAMMNSLEVRTPFIDVEMVNLMAQIPTKFKISRNFNGTWEKKKILNTIAAKRFGIEIGRAHV